MEVFGLEISESRNRNSDSNSNSNALIVIIKVVAPAVSTEICSRNVIPCLILVLAGVAGVGQAW